MLYVTFVMLQCVLVSIEKMTVDQCAVYIGQSTSIHFVYCIVQRRASLYTLDIEQLRYRREKTTNWWGGYVCVRFTGIHSMSFVMRENHIVFSYDIEI